jgi:hypothetical protein
MAKTNWNTGTALARTLSPQDRAQLAAFEACSERELASFRPETLALYRHLMARYAAQAACEMPHLPAAG